MKQQVVDIAHGRVVYVNTDYPKIYEVALPREAFSIDSLCVSMIHPHALAMHYRASSCDIIISQLLLMEIERRMYICARDSA